MEITTRIKNNFSDTVVLTGRMMRHIFRSIDTVITVAAMPILMMLMFVYVFGGAMNTGSSIDYVNYIVPGIILMTIASGIAYTAFRLNNDIKSGIFDRFHSMPIAKSAILGGHVMTSVVSNAISVILVMLIALVVGFRADAGIAGWLLVIGILLLVTLALTWLAVMFGLLANSAEGASAFSYVLLPLIFISPAFAPTANMPVIVRVFAENQPFTALIEAIRSILLNRPAWDDILTAVLWCIGILIFAYSAAMVIYRRKSL